MKGASTSDTATRYHGQAHGRSLGGSSDESTPITKNNLSKQTALSASCGPRHVCAMTMTNEGAVSASRGKRWPEGGR